MGSFTDDLLHRYKAQQAAGNVVDDTRDPTVARQAAVTGQQLGIPGPVVEADPKLYHNEVAAKKLQAQFGLDPHMADFFSNPDNAAVAKDDAPALGHISAAFGTADQVGDPLGARFISRMKASTAPGAWATRGALPGNAPTDNMLGTGDFNGALSTQQIRDVATHTGITTKSDLQSVNVLHALDTGLGATLDRTSLGIETFLADAVGMGDQYRGSDYYAQTRDALRKQEGRVDDLTSGFNDSQRWSYQAANSLGLLGIGVASGNPLAIFGATQGFGDYLTFRDRGATPNQAALGGGATAAIEVGTELLPMNYLLGQYGKKAAGKFLGGLLLREIPGELAATAGENLVDALMPGGVGWDQYKKDLPQAEIDTVASTVLSAGVTAGAEGIAHHRAEVAKAAQDSGIAAAGAKFLDQTMTAAAESKNRKENPETIRQFVEQRAEKTPVRNIYVPAETIAAYQQSEGYKAGDPIEQFQEQIDQAKATGGDVVIPIGDAAASLSGTPTWEAIKDNARVEPGGLSQKEALAKHDEIMAGLEARGKAIAEQAAAAGDAAQTPGNAGEVFTDVKNRLLAGGVSPNEAEQVAHIYAAHYDTQAKLWKDTRPDLTPMQAWQEAKVVFPGENKGQVQGRATAPVAPTPITKDANGNIAGPDRGTIKIQQHEKGSSALGSADVGAFMYTVRSSTTDANPLTMVLSKGGNLVQGNKVVGTDNESNGQAWVPPDEATAARVQALLEQRALTSLRSAERTAIDAQIKAIVTGQEAAPAGRQFGQETPLEGLPSRIKVDGQHVEFGPNAMARKAAAEHVAAQGLTYSPPTTYARVDPARATRIAQAFEEMKHEPNNPKVKRAYAAMMKETVAQWKAIEKTGLKVEFIKPGMADPYGNPRNAILDVQHNNHLWVFPTDDGFGGPASAGVDITGNPLLKTAPGVKIDGRAVKYNDVFRIVHDYFGHIKEGVGFRADGEENAWRMHSAMYSPEARAAMTTETRGQNSWVNFGPHGETNRTASPADTEYAPQKIGLLPDWVVNEGATDRTFDQAATIGGYEGLQQFLTDDEKKGLRQASIAKIMSIAENLPDAKEMAAVAVAGRAKRGWYENSAQAILDVFGAADGTRFAALLAALSPQTSVQANLYNALKTWTAWNEAGRPTNRKVIVEVMGKSVQGGKGVGSILTAWINNSVTALTHPEPAQIKLSGPKVDSFMNNLVGVVDEVTNDTWAANYAGVDPVLFKKTGQNKGPGYKAMNAVTRAAADVATKLTGEYWTPSEIQETVWSFAKTLYETRDKAGENRTMRQLLEAGRVTHDDIANTPDFATLFADGVYRTILEEGGYGNSLSTLGSNRRAVGVDGQASIASFDEGSGFTQADFSHFLAQAADRLEAVRNRRRGNVDTGGQRELFQQDVFNSLPNGDAVDAVGRVTAYHGTPFEFDRFSNDKGAVWFAEGRDLASQYSQGRRFRKATSGRVVEAELDIQHPLNITPEQLHEEGDHSVISNPVEWAKRNFGFDLKAHGWEKTGQDYAHAIFRSQAFADAAREAGYDAIAVTEQGHKTWGMLRPGSIISPEDGRTLNQSQPAFYSAFGGLPLFQGEQGPRGSVTMQDDGTRIIQLFGTANKSTLLHETGHIWVQQLFDDAKLDNAPAQIKADAKAMAAWFKSLGHPIGKDGVIPTEAHEYAARGFERFFGEGKAPTAALQPAFSRFRAWMLNIYKVLENLKAPITPEVREVFSRMLATQDAINEAAQSNHVEPLFKTAADAGMTDAEFADYQQRVGDARDAAYDALLYKTMEAIRRRETEKQRGQRATARAEAHTAISSTPEFRALHLLRTGRWLGETDRPETPVKLSTGWLMDNFGEDVLDKLPRGLPIANANGVDGDTVAQMVGMPSGQALVHALLGMRTATDALRASGDKRSLRETMVEDQVNKAMADRHGDTLTDGSIEEEAIAALNTARQGEIIASEARQLSKRNTALGTPTPYQFAREWAKRKIAAGNVRDVASRAAVQQHTRATAKAARLAEEAILKGDIDEAYRQKQAQLLNHALLAESKAAADRIDVIIARMRRLAGRAAMKSVDPGYFDKIHMLLENYDFRARSQRSVEEQAGFQTWAEAQRAKGFEVNIPPRLENKGLPYSKVSVQELESLGDVIDSLLHLGKTKQTLVTAGKERDFAEQIDTTVASIAQRKDRKLTRRVWRRGKLVKEDLSPINEKARVGASLASEIVKIEAIAEDLDGGKTGPMNDLLVRGAADAENRRIALREKIMRPIIKLYSDIGAKHWDRLQTNVTIPELTWNAVNEGDPRRGKTVTMTRMELLSVFMNMGNLSNLEKMTKGERWPAPTLHAVMERELVKEDYDLAQALWTQVEALWPEIVANERELSGVVPEKVVNNPISTRFGDYEGGYWPVVYDGSRWQRAEDLEGKKLDDMFGLKSGLATQKGHTIERTSAFGPLTYSLERVLLGHIDQVVTRIAYAAFARDTLRVIRNDRVRGIIDTKLGPEYRKQIEPWLARQIHEGAVNAKASAAWEKILRGFRMNTTIAGMGFRLSVGAAQISGLNASAARFAEGGNLATGAKWVAIGFKRYAQLIAQRNLDFVWSRSAEMTHRNDHFSREMSELSKKMQGRHSKWTDAQHWAMWHIGAADRYMVSLPTWLGAYEKGMKEGMTDEEASAYGDKEVRMSQGAGSEKDLSRWQSPNNDAMRFFTMFYTPFNVLFNAQWKSVREAKQGNFRPAIANGFWWMIASVLSDAMLSGDWPDPEDENGWAKWFARNVFFGLFAGVPIARDVAAYGERKVAGDYATFGTPIDRAMSSAEKGVKDAQLIAAGESPKRPIKEVGDLSALAFGVPTSAPGATGQFLWDYAHGEADPQSISDWYFGLTKGKVPPHDGAKQ